MYKIFIDGKEGTTGLRIFERFQNRDDIELITISDELRKNPVEKARLMNNSDLTFLCLPDQASIDAVSLVTNDKVKIIDTSTAFRTNDTWAYGFPELGLEYLLKIKNNNRVSVPGCHASGAIAILHPLIDKKMVSSDYPFSIVSVTGYSGGGKKMIAEYEGNREDEYNAPRYYGLTQNHKHLKEIVKHSGLSINPIFMPIVAPYYSGMVVSIGLILCKLNNCTKQGIYEMYKEYYKNQPFIRIQEMDLELNMVGTNNLEGKDYMEIFLFGNDERVTIMARFDNLGKGASGAAIECMNIMLGIDAKKGLNI